MKYTLEQKAQLMALKEPDRIYACELKDYVLITDGHIGYYIKKNNMLIICDKLRKPNSTPENLEPDIIYKATNEARKTRNVHMLPSGKMAIKLKNDVGQKVWVNMDFLKLFGDGVSYRISNEKDPVFISDHKGIPLGIVLPMRVPDEETEG